MDTHEQKLLLLQNLDRNAVQIELIRAATNIVIDAGNENAEHDSVVGAARAYLIAHFTPTIVSYPEKLGEPTKVEIEKLKEAWERFKSGPRYTPQEGGWK